MDATNGATIARMTLKTQLFDTFTAGAGALGSEKTWQFSDRYRLVGFKTA